MLIVALQGNLDLWVHVSDKEITTSCLERKIVTEKKIFLKVSETQLMSYDVAYTQPNLITIKLFLLQFPQSRNSSLQLKQEMLVTCGNM